MGAQPEGSSASRSAAVVPGPFDRLFAGWPDVLVQAGVATHPDTVGGVGRSIARTDSGGKVVYRRSGYCYTDEQRHGAQREIAERLGHSPKTNEYKAAATSCLPRSSLRASRRGRSRRCR